VAFAIDALAPAPPPSAPVVVAVGDLTPGTRLTSDDLRVVAWPTDLAPPGAVTTIAAAVGRTLAAAVGQGEAITGLRFVGPTLAAALAHDGRVAVPVRLADADAAALLRPGDRVDLVSATAGSADPVDGTSGGPEAAVVAAGATVISVPAADDGSALIGGRGDAGGSLVVVSVTRPEALALARAAVLGPLSIVLVA
jgi:pilus assembly protein CpaB